VSTAKLPAYKALVDLFFWYAATQNLMFKAVVFDRRQIDCRVYHENDDLLAFDRLFYHFLLHKCGSLATCDEDRLYVFLDEKDRRTTLDRFKEILNRGIRKQYGRGVDVVRTVEHVRSHDYMLVRVADVLMGAVRYHCSGDYLASGASAAKAELARHIAAKANLRSLSMSTPRGWPYVDIWRFDVSKSRKAKATP
jgi:hypothetical protein